MNPVQPSASLATSPRPISRSVLWTLGVLGALPLVAYVVMSVSAAFGAPIRLNHDVAQYLSAGERLLGGAVPFVDLIDTNPPLIFYLSAVPAAVSGLFNISLGAAGTATFTVVGLGLLGGVLACLRRGGLSPTAALLVVTAWFHVGMTAYTRPEVLGYGQRDLLIGGLLVLWAVVRHSRYAGLGVRRSLAILAGIGALAAVGMKPQYVLALAAVEVYLRAEARRWTMVKTPDVAAFVVSGIVYAGHLLLLPGASAFYTYWLPTIRAGYGAAYDPPFSAVVSQMMSLSSVWLIGSAAAGAVACLGVIAARWVPRVRSSRGMQRAAVLAVVALAMLGVYVVQHKGWPYHLLAFDLAGLTALALAAGAGIDAGVRRVAKRGPESVALSILVAGTLMAGLVVQAVGSLPGAEVQAVSAADADAIRRATRPGDAVLHVGTVKGGYPALTLSGRRAAGRYLNSFPAHIALRRTPTGYRIAEPWRDLEERYRRDVLEDIARAAPALIITSTTPGSLSGDIYFRHSGLWEQLRADYREGATQNRLRMYHRRDRPLL